jgi:hypothetical protein
LVSVGLHLLGLRRSEDVSVASLEVCERQPPVRGDEPVEEVGLKCGEVRPDHPSDAERLAAFHLPQQAPTPMHDALAG